MQDNLDEVLGGQSPSTPFPVQEAWHNEQKRKQYDIIRIKNPSTITVKGIDYELPAEDFYIEYDTNQYQRIPANSIRDIPRFRADRYVEHMKDKIINYVNQKLHDDFLAERDRKGLPRFVDKATENRETYETQDYPKTNDPEVIAEIFNQIWLGLVNKAGNDLPPDMAQRSPELNVKPISQQILDKLRNKTVAPEDISYPVQPEEVKRAPAVEPLRPTGFSQMSDQLDAADVSKPDIEEVAKPEQS